MDLICPLCNGLEEYSFKCEQCNGIMDDKGRIIDYFDEYSPYLEMSITELIDGAPRDKCVHLLTCKYCNSDKRIYIDKVIK